MPITPTPGTCVLCGGGGDVSDVCVVCPVLITTDEDDPPAFRISNAVAIAGEVTVQSSGTGPYRNLNGVATGTGADVHLQYHTTTTMIVATSAGVSAGVVALQVSMDGLIWFTAGTVTTNAANATFAVTTIGAWSHARASITTNITGGTITADLSAVGY